MSRCQLNIAIPEKLIPVFQGEADVRGAYGGRGSAKSRSFAKMAAVIGLRFGQAGVKGQILCARQFMNSLDDSSLEECKRAIQDEPILSAYYEIGDKYIKSKDGNIEFSFAGLDRNIASIKSKGRILLCWVDEAEPVTDTAWSTLIPTLREEGDNWNAELWVTWNPLRKSASVEKRFRTSIDPRVKIVELNWRDNPRFPAILERARQRDLSDRPDEYDHIWDGAYKTHFEGAYYSKHIAIAKSQNRICHVGRDPLMAVRCFWDIGGTGAKADACSIWVEQFIGKEIRSIDYYEAVGQPLSEHVGWLKRNGYEGVNCVLPHDGAQHDKIVSATYEGALKQAGFPVDVVPNQGAGAAYMRIEAVRRLFSQMWFDKEKTQAGLDALAAYREKRDENRNIGLGALHDWASHGADAFGLMAIWYEKWQAGLNVRKVAIKKMTVGDAVAGY